MGKKDIVWSFPDTLWASSSHTLYNNPRILVLMLMLSAAGPCFTAISLALMNEVISKSNFPEQRNDNCCEMWHSWRKTWSALSRKPKIWSTGQRNTIIDTTSLNCNKLLQHFWQHIDHLSVFFIHWISFCNCHAIWNNASKLYLSINIQSHESDFSHSYCSQVVTLYCSRVCFCKTKK